MVANVVDFCRVAVGQVIESAGIDAAAALADVRGVAEVIEPPPLSAPASRNRDDDTVLTLAAAGQVDVIVSGDDDRLGSYAGIPILDPGCAIQRLAQPGAGD